jgi:hypothetical protein
VTRNDEAAIDAGYGSASSAGTEPAVLAKVRGIFEFNASLMLCTGQSGAGRIGAAGGAARQSRAPSFFLS